MSGWASWVIRLPCLRLASSERTYRNQAFSKLLSAARLEIPGYGELGDGDHFGHRRPAIARSISVVVEVAADVAGLDEFGQFTAYAERLTREYFADFKAT